MGDDACHELSYDLYFIALLLGPSVGQYIQFKKKKLKVSSTQTQVLSLSSVNPHRLAQTVLTNPTHRICLQ